MNHTCSNLNVLRKNKHTKSSNKNNFNKSSKAKKSNVSTKINLSNNFYYTNTNNNFYNSIDFPLTKTSENKTNYQLHLPIKSSGIKNDNINKKYTLKISNSNKLFSFNKNKYNTTSHKKSHHIRLDLNHEIINTNFPTSITENYRKNFKRKNTDIFYAEKIKEKNYIINKLKKELIISEMVLNNIKNKDDTYDPYDSIDVEEKNIIINLNNKDINNGYNNFNNRKVNSLTSIGPFLSFNFINNNHIIYNKNNYNKSISPKNNSINKNKNFYSLPSTNNNKYDSIKVVNITDRKKEYLSSEKEINNKNRIIFIKKSNLNKAFSLNDFYEKCNNLKKRSKNILDKYIELYEYLNHKKKVKNN